jgi:predicted dehydrogenase
LYEIETVHFQPDFVIISNPTHLHSKTIKEAVRFECPIFIEKPALHTLENSDELLKIILKKKIITYIACNLRFLSCLQFLKVQFENSISMINEANIYCGSFLPNWRPNSDYRKIYSSDKETGGGVHLDLIHELDYLFWLFGNPINAFALRRNVSTLNISAADYANYTLIYNNFVANVVLNYYRQDPKRTFEIVFNDKTWMVDLLKNSIFEDKKIIFESESTIQDTYLEQMKYFIKCIQENKQPMNSLEESVNVLKICLTKSIYNA